MCALPLPAYLSSFNSSINKVVGVNPISIIAGCSSGIEPIFALSFVRNIMDHTKLIEVNPVFECLAKKKGFYNQGLMSRIAQFYNIKNKLFNQK